MGISAQTTASISLEADHLGLRETLSKAEPAGLEAWAGASGRQYPHLVYGLIACPVVPKANYVLVRRASDGRRDVLKVGRVSHDAPTLNLAQIRHEGALLGANEVHVHGVARTEAERILIEVDITAGTRAHSDAAETAAVRH